MLDAYSVTTLTINLGLGLAPCDSLYTLMAWFTLMVFECYCFLNNPDSDTS